MAHKKCKKNQAGKLAALATRKKSVVVHANLVNLKLNLQWGVVIWQKTWSSKVGTLPSGTWCTWWCRRPAGARTWACSPGSWARWKRLQERSKLSWNGEKILRKVYFFANPLTKCFLIWSISTSYWQNIHSTYRVVKATLKNLDYISNYCASMRPTNRPFLTRLIEKKVLVSPSAYTVSTAEIYSQ